MKNKTKKRGTIKRGGTRGTRGLKNKITNSRLRNKLFAELLARKEPVSQRGVLKQIRKKLNNSYTGKSHTGKSHTGKSHTGKSPMGHGLHKSTHKSTHNNAFIKSTLDNALRNYNSEMSREHIENLIKAIKFGNITRSNENSEYIKGVLGEIERLLRYIDELPTSPANKAKLNVSNEEILHRTNEVNGVIKSYLEQIIRIINPPVVQLKHLHANANTPREFTGNNAAIASANANTPREFTGNNAAIAIASANTPREFTGNNDAIAHAMRHNS